MKGRNKVLLMIISVVLFLALITTIILGEIKFDRYNSLGNNKNGLKPVFYSISS
ncbi:hypothetical protein ACPWSR_00825 [Alloiococcus sp. CFN-8]|uniref:hypothetical protein n=1 Tax=Alloiococcus sp. CFN-8 TaxID=3416081 RepID=UPI003CEDA650